MAGSQVAADWAWISKPPGGIGYGILAASGRADLNAFVGQYGVGTPSPAAEPGTPEAPPWVTFAPFPGGGEDGLVSVSARDPWWERQERDNAGRPVWPRRFFLFRFADLAQAGASFRTVWQAVESKPLVPGSSVRQRLADDGALSAGYVPGDTARAPRPATGREMEVCESAPRVGQPLLLSVGSQSLAALAGVIGEYSFEWVAGLAVAVLEGPVAIAGAARLPREQRLGLLDAVAALLPYGLRAGLSVSSSVDNTTDHGIRVVFADFPRRLTLDGVASEQQVVALGAGMPGPRTETGARYLTMLRQKKDARGAEGVISHLWTDKSPRAFARPKATLAVLDGFDRAGSTKRDLLEGRATSAQVLRLFREMEPAALRDWLHAGDMTDELRERALSLLLERLDPVAAEVLVSHWRVLADDVLRLIARQLDDGDPALAAWCLEVSRTLSGGVEDQILARLLVPERVISHQRYRSAVVNLVGQRVVPPQDSFPATCAVLRHGELDGWQALLVRDLLAREIAADPGLDRALAWSGWLCLSQPTGPGEYPVWVAALAVVLGARAGDRALVCLRAMIGDAAWAVTVLRLARGSGRRPTVLVAMAPALLDLALQLAGPPAAWPGQPTSQWALPGGDRGEEVRRALDGSLRQHNVPADTLVIVDVVRVLLGGAPADLPIDQSHEIIDHYGDRLRDLLVTDPVRPWLSQVQQGILAAAVPGGPPSAMGLWLLNTWPANPEMVPGLLRHIRRLGEEAFPYSEQLSTAFWDMLRQDQHLARFASAQRIMSAARDAAANPALLYREAGTTGLSPTDLALACHSARQAGLPVQGIVDAMAQVLRSAEGTGRRQAIEPQVLDAVLREFQALSFHSGRDDGASSERDLDEFWFRIARGAFGREYGRRFRVYLRRRMRDDIREQRRKRRTILAKRPGRRVKRAFPTGDVPVGQLMPPHQQAAARQYGQDATASPRALSPPPGPGARSTPVPHQRDTAGTIPPDLFGRDAVTVDAEGIARPADGGDAAALGNADRDGHRRRIRDRVWGLTVRFWSGHGDQAPRSGPGNG